MNKKTNLLISCVIFYAGCATTPVAPKLSLSNDDTGELWFKATPSLKISSDRSSISLSEEPLTLSGKLEFPSKNGIVPAVVLAHGCNGVGGAETAWAKALHEWGYATFIIDSLKGRALKEVCTDYQALHPTSANARSTLARKRAG